MSRRVVVLGAGFGGLELSTMLSEALRRRDRGDADRQGRRLRLRLLQARRDVRARAPDAVRLPYADIAKPGVAVLRETVTAIDPEARRVTTDAGTHEADALVVALGADYDFDATPGLLEAGNEFYSVAGAERLAEVIPTFSEGHAVIGVCGAPFKCPPAPSECALLLDEELRSRGRARRLSDLLRDPAADAGAALARGLRGAGSRVRRARHRADHRPPRHRARPRAQRRAARRRRRAAVRPLPRRARSTARPRW